MQTTTGGSRTEFARSPVILATVALSFAIVGLSGWRWTLTSLGLADPLAALGLAQHAFVAFDIHLLNELGITYVDVVFPVLSSDDSLHLASPSEHMGFFRLADR